MHSCNVLFIFLLISLTHGFDITEETKLEDLCNIFHVPKVNCTCEIIPQVCNLLIKKNDTSAVIVQHECDILYHSIQESINIFAAVVGIIGNTIVVMVTVQFWDKATRCHQLIGGLAALDLAFCLIQLLFSIPRLWTCKWPYGLAMCKFLSAGVNWCQVTALGFIGIIAIERYIGIVHPFSKGLSRKWIFILIGCNFFSAILFVTPSLLYLKISRFGMCQEHWPAEYSSLIYTWSWMVIYFLIPIICIACLYYRILTVLINAAKVSVSGNDYFQQKRVNDNKRIMAILVTVLVAFALLVFPNRLAWVIIEHIGVNNVTKDTYRALNLFGFIPYSFHVAVNPIIYSLIDANFRQKVKVLFRRMVEMKVESSSGKTQSTEPNTNSPVTQTRHL